MKWLYTNKTIIKIHAVVGVGFENFFEFGYVHQLPYAWEFASNQFNSGLIIVLTLVDRHFENSSVAELAQAW